MEQKNGMSLVVNVTQDWGIGRENQLLVSLPGDLRRFRQLTIGKTVILGRRTLATFPGGRPLPGRENFILSRDPAFQVPGARVFSDLPALLQAARALGIRRVIVHAGFVPNVYFPSWFLSQSADFFCSLLSEEPAAQDMELLLENVLEPRPALLTELILQIGDPRVGLCLDLGHAATMASEIPALDWIAPMAPYLRHVHLHNNEGREDLHQPLCQGVIPMRRALDQLLQLDGGITFTIENQDCAPSLDFLAAHGLWEASK